MPFVHARVVLAEKPTSARPGDEALVLADGTMEGFVGGDCAEATVRAQALAVLDSGEPVVLRISATDEPPQAGKVMAHNPCLSGGTLGDLPRTASPAAADGRRRRRSDRPGAAHASAQAVGFEVVDADAPDLAALVVASHGRDEAAPLSAALEAGVDYVGLVASPKRGAAVVAALDVGGRRADRHPRRVGHRRPHAGGGRTVDLRRRDRPAPSTLGPAGSRRRAHHRAPRSPIDPVCGMPVAAVESSLHLDHDGRRYWFCGTGCLRAFAAEPDRYPST